MADGRDLDDAEAPRLVYNMDDVLHLIRPLPYMGMMRERNAIGLLKRQTATIAAWRDFLPRYRTVLVAPLEFAYQYLRCLGAFDKDLLEDLCCLDHTNSYTWRGVVIGAWLVALAPRQEYRETLLRARPHVPYNQWLVDLAVAAIDETRPQENVQHFDLLAIIREALAPIPRPAIALRRYDYSTAPEFARAKGLVADIYRTQGTDAALRQLAAEPALDIFRPSRPSGARWHWGMVLPFSMEDLMAWKPPSGSKGS
jgi:hypothetical protein